MNKRVEAKEKTRQKAITAARKAFAVTDYHAVSIRDLAKAMGMSTGAIFANFTSKADLWRASMPLTVPADIPVTRASMMLIDALERALAEMEFHCGNHSLGEIQMAKKAIALATSPLDGDVWARHLANTPVPFPTFEPEQAASLAPSDDAAAQA